LPKDVPEISSHSRPAPRRVKLHRVWTRRHYRPYLTGAIAGGVYAVGVRWGCESFHIAPPTWLVALIGQGALWLGIWLGRLTWFD